MSDKDRDFVPVGVTTKVTKNSDETKTAENPEPAMGSKDEAIGTVSVSTTPGGAEVYADDQFYGNGPATSQAETWKTYDSRQDVCYKDWSREISTDAGSEAHLSQTSKNQTSDYVHSNLELASTWSSDRRVLRAVVL